MSNPFTDSSQAEGAPSWLSEAPSAPPPAPGASKIPSVKPIGVPTSLEPLEEPEPQLKRYMLIVRVVNMVMTILIATCSVLTLQQSTAAATVVIALYLFVFAVMIFCFELALNIVAKKISENCGFMYSAKGRAVFFFFIGILCFDLKPTVFAYIDGILMILIAIGNFYLLVRYPKFEMFQRRKHFYGSYTSDGAKGPNRV